MGKGYGIAGGHRATVEAGAEVLAAGGTAVDAALASAAMAMVAEPVLAGLLGGGFLMLRAPNGACRLLDAFVDTPVRQRSEADLDLREIRADFGDVTQAFHIGAGTVAAPCLVEALFEAHERYGRMPIRELLAPAADAARRGLAITDFQARLSQIVAPILLASPAARALHCDATGALLPVGALRANPDFGAVLEELAVEGPRFVTDGEIAAGLCTLTEAGGHLTREDRARPVWRDPLSEQRGTAQLALTPPPALGGTLVAFALALLPHRPDAATLARAFAETAEARCEVDLERDAASGASALAEPTRRARYAARVANLAHPTARRGTTHVSILDPDGLGVALTLSNGEGCGLVIPGTGIMPNNMLGEEDLVPGLATGAPLGWATGVRMASMMAPMAIDWGDGRAIMLGSGGSNRIRTALTQVVIRLIDEARPLGEAIEAPRLHVEGARDPQLDFETEGLGERDRAALTQAWPEGRAWAARSMFFGGVHAVARQADESVAAYGDPRRDGQAITG
ncbi:MAG: gamma-glutamyltransferase [Pikeienuella sp.]